MVFRERLLQDEVLRLFHKPRRHSNIGRAQTSNFDLPILSQKVSSLQNDRLEDSEAIWRSRTLSNHTAADDMNRLKPQCATGRSTDLTRLLPTPLPHYADDAYCKWVTRNSLPLRLPGRASLRQECTEMHNQQARKTPFLPRGRRYAPRLSQEGSWHEVAMMQHQH
jgi:hypothetical protein